MVTKTKTATDFLAEARDFISDPARWCQGNLAVDEFGNPVASERVLGAAKCCAIGSLQRTWFAASIHDLVESYEAAGELLDRTAARLYPEAADRRDLGPVAYVNDHLGHAAILRVYDAAIAASQELDHA